MKRVLPLVVATLFLWLGSTPHGHAFLDGHSEKMVPTSRQEIHLSFSPVIKRVAPAVVNIYTRTVVRQRVLSPLMYDPFFRELFGNAYPRGLTQKRVQNSLGSGVIVGADGLVVTNNHVIDGADQITVVLHDRREFEADVVATDKRSDLAVLRLKTRGETFPTLPFADSDDAEVGDVVLAIGNPFGVGQTVTMGIVSAVARSADVGSSDYNYFIQTDASINPGNSGGALVSVDGRLIGVPSAIYSKDGGSLGIGFAIPSNLVKAVVASAGNGGKIERGWLGLSAQTLNSDIAKSVGLSHPTGVIVRELHPQSPIRKSGIKVGDVILAVNGKEIMDEDALRYRMATVPVNSVVTFTLLSDGKKRDVAVTLIAPPESDASKTILLKGRSPLSGARITELSPALAQELSMPEDSQGVMVLEVARGSFAARLGLRKGDRLVAINNQEITTTAEAEKALQQDAGLWRISIDRGGNVMTLVVQ